MDTKGMWCRGKFNHLHAFLFQFYEILDTQNSTNKCHQDNMSVWSIPLFTPLLYSKNGVYRGILLF